MFEIINDTDREVLELDILNDYVKYLVKKLELEKCEFNIIIVDNEKIHEINKQYRNIDRETDVISFALEDNMDIKYEDFRLLGDIYISIDKCYGQALEYGHSRMREICFLATHGILHLLGYDHIEESDEKEMFGLQDELLDDYDIKR
ncbi:MAG: rRNA maturation RNase YbeY [Bacilli bacterium]|nr:rRNA maturation RNase YbeY [Bacilli bacterium]